MKLFMTKLLYILWLLLSDILSLRLQNDFSHEDRKNRDAKRRFFRFIHFLKYSEHKTI